ncbi:hypothetical protein ACH495_16530 [Micromonospora sp. NPDC018662]|uniref:hypothetical protein n=1 Tax=Micromonospora sp. NPDC018662 TaxID=3364238 RepID=UPI00379E4AC2
MSTDAERDPEWPGATHVPADELARRQGVEPVAGLEQLARPELFESDDELDRFLADLYASRRDGVILARAVTDSVCDQGGAGQRR